MPRNHPLEDAIVQFIKDNPGLYTPLHKAVHEQTRGRPLEELFSAARPLALGRLAAMRAGRGREVIPHQPLD